MNTQVLWLAVYTFIVVYMVGISLIFRDVTPCSWVSGYRRFEWSNASISSVVGHLNPWRSRHYVSPKSRGTLTQLNSVTSWKSWFLSYSAVESYSSQLQSSCMHFSIASIEGLKTAHTSNVCVCVCWQRTGSYYMCHLLWHQNIRILSAKWTQNYAFFIIFAAKKVKVAL